MVKRKQIKVAPTPKANATFSLEVEVIDCLNEVEGVSRSYVVNRILKKFFKIKDNDLDKLFEDFK